MQLVTKAAFAERVGRSPGAISQWIAAGKIGGAALVGEGRRALIDVDQALAQLGRTLDLGQQLAQPKPLIAGPSRPAATSAAQTATPPADDQGRLLKARADREEIGLDRPRQG